MANSENDFFNSALDCFHDFFFFFFGFGLFYSNNNFVCYSQRGD